MIPSLPASITTAAQSDHDAAPESPDAAPQQKRRPAWRPLAVLFLVGIVIFLPAIRSGYLLDDYLHASMIDGTFPAHRGPFDLYSFVDDADRTTLIERGMLPWWSHPRLTIRFFRPLSSALLWGDHHLFGNRPLPLHLHSLAWWVAAVLAARALFKRHFSPRVALIATIVFALAPCHVLPLGWLANREALVSFTLGVVALGAYVRFREGQGARNGLVATALFALSVLGGEYAICIGGYVLAYEIFRPGDGPLRRAIGLLPFGAPAAAYLLARRALHYGAVGSGFYADPFREPAAFFEKAPRRLVTLLAQAWLTLDQETFTSSTPWWILALVAAAGVALLYLPIRRAFARLDDEPRRTASWLLLGAFFALGPVLAVVPSPRLLAASLLGFSVTIALVIDNGWFPEAGADRRGAELGGLVALALGFSHFVHGPATSWLIARHFQESATSFASNAAELEARIADPRSAEVVVLRGMGGSFFLPFGLGRFGALPGRWRILAQTGHALAMRRGPRTLDIIVPEDQGAFPVGNGNLFRSEQTRMAAGDRFNLPGLRVSVLEMGKEGPRVVRYEFDRELEASSLTWLTEDFDGFHDAHPPKIGFGMPLDP